jgi:putative resolvase
MKLSAYARQIGVSYRTAVRWFRSGKIQGRQRETGTLLIPAPVGEPPAGPERPAKIAVYTRVWAAENKDHLDGQAKRLQDDCAAKGYPVTQGVKDIGSGVKATRPKRLKWLTDPTVTLMVVEPKDRLTRFGFTASEPGLKLQARRLEVSHLAEAGKEDLIQDCVSLVTRLGARRYGPRRSKRKTERLLAELAQPPAAAVGPA